MFLFTKDDPIIGAEAIAYEECYKNPNVLLGVTNIGGHTAYHENFMKPE